MSNIITIKHGANIPTIKQLEEYEKETEDVKVVKIDREQNLELKEALKIPSVPTILIIKDGKEIARESREFDKEGLEELVKTSLEK